ncbi:unnamed protein product [Lepeophtheirus salmonis]|uniref:(salmon louse) hypothetical protein n=1 Tax=Lepeophtheirus salmonis TaxID=72036 RepID=A0A7R8H599_LEPSM|nr:unnamed protein product [Lepeophtheirus salmonis]CAF2877272.1 unnamed protein product [Lepeophtheirus salmonis]
MHGNHSKSSTKDILVSSKQKLREHWKEYTLESLPNASTIPKTVLEQLGVDVFFSLWFVFLNDQIPRTDSTPFTILAPINYSKTNPEILLNQEDITKEVVINHIIMGETIRPESLLNSKVRESLGKRKLSFTIDAQGELWVNDVRILGWTIVPNGIIFALEDYLFTKEPPFSTLTESLLSDISPIEEETEISYPRDIKNSANISVAHNNINSSEDVEWVRKEVCRNVSNAKVTLFKNVLICVEKLVKVPKKNLTHLEKLPKNISLIFQTNPPFSKMANTFYTVLIPNDGAFRHYQPIDWGFNPFDVESFVKEVVLNAFIEGTISSSGEYKSLLGQRYMMTIANGTITSIEAEDLKHTHGYLESAPLIHAPFKTSPFLSYVWEKLSKLKEYSYIVEYMNATLDFGSSASSINPSRNKEDGYTLFVPRDDAFWRIFIQDAGAPDPFFCWICTSD